MKFDNINLKHRTLILILFSVYLTLIIMIVATVSSYKHHLHEDYTASLKAAAHTIENLDSLDKTNEAFIKSKFYCTGDYCQSSIDTNMNSIHIEYLEANITLPVYELMHKVQLKNGDYIITYIPVETFNEHVEHLRSILLQIFFIVSFICTLVIIYLVRKLFMPLECLTKLCDDASEQKSSIPLCTQSSYEIKKLHKAILHLMQTNKKFYNEKVTLFKEIAHELKSPIAIIQARVSLLGHPVSQNELSKYKEQTNENISDIKNKIYELLFIEEIELELQKEEAVSFSIGEQCKMMQERFAPILKLHNLSFSSDLKDDLVIHTYKKPMQKVMQAIFENIFIHAKEGTTLYVEVDVEKKIFIIKNVLQEKGSSKHNSTYIGTKIIQGFCDKLNYDYQVKTENNYYITRIEFLS